MSISDPLSDMLTRIRNGQQARLDVISSPASKLLASVLDVLQKEGFIRGYNHREVREGIRNIEIELKYHEGKPVIREIKRISKPGCRVYSGIQELSKVYGGLGISVLSTPKGVMSDHEARVAHIGGEVLCKVF